jgi:hypothetical protein
LSSIFTIPNRQKVERAGFCVLLSSSQSLQPPQLKSLLSDFLGEAWLLVFPQFRTVHAASLGGAENRIGFLCRIDGQKL